MSPASQEKSPKRKTSTKKAAPKSAGKRTAEPKPPSQESVDSTLSPSLETNTGAFVPPQPLGSFRVVLQLKAPKPRLDTVLLEAVRQQRENLQLRVMSRGAFKKLFEKNRIKIKGQNARPSSSLASGITYVDILGFQVDEKSKGSAEKKSVAKVASKSSGTPRSERLGIKGSSRKL